MKFDISHKTLYRYEAPVVHSHQCLHLTPRELPRQRLHTHTLLIEPAPSLRHDSVDSFGNPTVMLEIDHQHDVFVVHATSTISVDEPPVFDVAATPRWEIVAAAMEKGPPPFDLDVVQFATPSRLTPPSHAVADYAEASFTPGRAVAEAALDLTRRIFADFRFDATATDVSTPIDEVLRMRRGVCQDFSHLALACLRAMGLPARYVSGYLLTRPPPGMPKLRGADASHAWVSVAIPGLGWIDFDPTNGIMPSDEHVAIAFGRDYDDVNPISGIILGGANHSVTVAVDVDAV